MKEYRYMPEVKRVFQCTVEETLDKCFWWTVYYRRNPVRKRRHLQQALAEGFETAYQRRQIGKPFANNQCSQ